MALKQKYFFYRDLIRFNWARSKFHYLPQGKTEDFAFSKVNHIVVLKVDGKLGDTEVMSHFYRNILNLPHKPRLSVVCPENLVPIYRDVLKVAAVYPVSRKPKQPEIERICADILSQGGKVDLVLSTEPNYRPRDFIFNYCLKPDYIAGCDPRLNEINLFLFHPRSFDQPIAVAFAAFLQRGGVEPSPIAYEPFITGESSAHARAYLELPEHDLYIGINPCGASKRHQFTPEVVATIMHMILAAHPQSRVLLLLPRAQQEYLNEVMALLSAQERALVGSRIKLLPEQCSVIDYCTYIDNIRGLITVDTAAVHLACASEVPQLSFYQGALDESTRWAPVYACDDPAGCTRCQRFVGLDDLREAPKEEIYRLSHEFINKLIAFLTTPQVQPEPPMQAQGATVEVIETLEAMATANLPVGAMPQVSEEQDNLPSGVAELGTLHKAVQAMATMPKKN